MKQVLQVYFWRITYTRCRPN